jgi:hypothetical protein
MNEAVEVADFFRKLTLIAAAALRARHATAPATEFNFTIRQFHLDLQVNAP